MSFVDPDTKLSEPELDRLKSQANLRMVAARNLFIWEADCVGMRAHREAHKALLACRTEREVARIEVEFGEAMARLREAILAKA